MENKDQKISELTAQMLDAANKNDHAAVKQLSNQIQDISQASTFEQAWGFEPKKSGSEPNAFEKAWGICGTPESGSVTTDG